jgi:hypothetical protein
MVPAIQLSVATTQPQCQQTHPHMPSLYFSTIKDTIHESLSRSGLQTQKSHQNVMLHNIYEKIFNPPRLDFVVSIY